MSANKIFLVILFTTLFGNSSVFAEKIPNGVYRQTSVNPSDWGECPSCKMTVSHETPHSIRWESNNGTVGHANYDDEKDSYSGSWEWKSGKGGYYENEVFDAKIFYDGKTITMDVKSRKTGQIHSITLRKFE